MWFSRSFRKWIWLPLVVIVLLTGVYVLRLATQERPSVVSVSPEGGAAGVVGLRPVLVEFSHPMSLSSLERSVVISPALAGEFTFDNPRTVRFTPEEIWPEGVTVSVTIQTSARSAIGLSLAAPFAWTFKTAQIMLAYLYPLTPPSQLFALDPLSGDTLLLVDAPEGILDYSFSPDGLTIYYSTPLPGGGSQIYRVERSSGEARLLYTCVMALCQRPLLSPDGERLVFEDTTNIKIWLVDADDGGNPVQIQGTRHPLWSDKGALAVYDDASQAYLIHDLVTRTVLQLPNETGEPGVWRPGGVGFIAAEIATGATSHLYDFDLSGGAPVMIDLMPGDHHENNTPAVSPDGTMLAFAKRFLDEERWTRGRQLWVIEADGSNPRPLTEDGFYNYTSFAWSPDSTQIAMLRFNESFLGEAPEIWLVYVDGSDLFRLVINGHSPQWIPYHSSSMPAR